MIQRTIKILGYTPFIFLANGYWMLSNRQIFENIINQITHSSENMNSAHDFRSMLQLTTATPMLAISITILMIATLRTCCNEKMRKMGYDISSTTFEVQENLPNFYEAVKLSETSWFVAESRYLRYNYNFSFASNTMITRLEKEKFVPKKAIQGLAWYNILFNPAYARAFNYVSVDTPNREKMIGDIDGGCDQSDLVALIINLGFLRHAKDFEFRAG